MQGCILYFLQHATHVLTYMLEIQDTKRYVNVILQYNQNFIFYIYIIRFLKRQWSGN